MWTPMGRGGRSGRSLTRGVASAVVALGTLVAGPAGATAAATMPARSVAPGTGAPTAIVGHARLHLLHGQLPTPGPTGHSSSVHDSYAISDNWSGQIATGGNYTGVSADWKVPQVPDTGNDWEYSATWIGIDGTTSTSLIQTGTAQQSTIGGPNYYAWYEALPGAEVPIDEHVVPGDAIQASVTETSPNVWRIVVVDATQAWTFTKQFSYTTPGASAEWVEEAPTIGNGLATLSDYGSATFTDMGVTGQGAVTSTYTPVFMGDSNDSDIISWPDPYAGTGSFTVHYGSPTPVITSVTPASGPDSGETVLTISGQYLFAASDVRFGTQPASGFYVNPDGSMTVASPPGSGTVDIHLTSADTQSGVVPADRFTYSPSAPEVSHGYWLVGADGGIFSFGSAGFHGSTGNLVLQRPVVGITPTADRNGYWLVATDGGVFAFGDAGFYGSLPGLGIAPAGSGSPRELNAPLVGMVPSADGHGYFMVAADGGVFAFGDAQFEGSCPGRGGCAGRVVSVVPDATGHGYWLVTATGHVSPFGDAPNEGQPVDDSNGQPLPYPVTSAVRTPDGAGYWVILGDAQVLAFGDARYYPPTTGYASATITPENPVAAIFATDDSLGYWIATADGSVFDSGDAPDDGSMATEPLNAPIIAAAGW
jgi:hypothetical protein